MKKSSVVVIVVAGSLITGVGLSAAHAQGLGPKRTEPSTALLKTTDLPDAWRSATAEIRDPLPKGFQFPVHPPAFFDADESGNAQEFAPLLPQQIAARWWRCAWIASALDASLSDVPTATEEAESMVGRWYKFPGVRGEQVFADYDSQIRTAAKAVGESAFRVEFDLDCGRLIFDEKEEK